MKAGNGVGTAYKLNCKHCTYSRDVFLGIGFSHMYLSSILPIIKNTEARQRITSFISDESAKHDSYEALFVCGKCNNLHNELFLQIKSNSDRYEISYNCSRCSAS